MNIIKQKKESNITFLLYETELESCQKTVQFLYAYQYGGADGIRTHAPVTRSTSLAGKPLEPLEYYSNYQALFHYNVKCSACQLFFSLYAAAITCSSISFKSSGLFFKNSFVFSLP